MRSWALRHARVLVATLGRLARAPLGSLLNIVVLGIALALPAGLYLALVNLQSLARAGTPEPQLSVFLELDTARADVQALGERLTAHSDVRAVRFVPREQALEHMKRLSGMSDLLDGLPRNPLPDAYVIDARAPHPELLERLHGEITGWPYVAHVQLDSAWAQRLDALLAAGRTALLLVATLLACALVAVTFNTIRLQILTQREEIEVASLIGATHGYVRRPFVYHGALLGLLGGLAALAIVWAASAALGQALGRVFQAYGAQWSPLFFSPADVASLLAFATFLGWLGAWLSVARHLAEFRPR
jgi:cell division transport system permease protein